MKMLFFILLQIVLLSTNVVFASDPQFNFENAQNEFNVAKSVAISEAQGSWIVLGAATYHESEFYSDGKQMLNAEEGTYASIFLNFDTKSDVFENKIFTAFEHAVKFSKAGEVIATSKGFEFKVVQSQSDLIGMIDSASDSCRADIIFKLTKNDLLMHKIKILDSRPECAHLPLIRYFLYRKIK
jgi:hypothetical protein